MAQEKKTSDVLRLQANVPETIAVKFTDGLAVASNFGGDQVMFTLVDGRKLFLPPIVAKKMADAGVEANQPFEICKREVPQGNRRIVEYQVAALAAQPVPAPAPARASRPTGRTVTPINNGNNGHYTPLAAPAPDADPSSVTLLKIAGMQAIDAILEIEGHARLRGMTDFEFSPECVEKFAIALFIDIRQKGGRA